MLYISLVPVRARSDSRHASDGRPFQPPRAAFQRRVFRVGRLSADLRLPHVLDIAGVIARRRTGENFVGVRHKTSARRSQSREGSTRWKSGRRKTVRFCANCGGLHFAFLRLIRSPSGSPARIFRPRRNAALRLSTFSFNPLSHGAPSLARRLARNPSGRPEPRPGPRRGKRKGDPGQRPRHACKSPPWPTK
jgi:hypothetical protein